MQGAYTEVHQRTRKDTEGQARTPAENKNFKKKTFQTITVAIVLGAVAVAVVVCRFTSRNTSSEDRCFSYSNMTWQTSMF